jgi:hypothetical protein
VDQSGALFLVDLNAQLAAIASNNSGVTAPSTAFAYQWWADTTTGLLKIRNAANSAWVTVGTLSATNFGLAPLASPTFTGTVTIPTVSLTTPLTIADGGTGQGTAAGAFNAIKQAATTSAMGVVELATDAEAQTGTDATRCVTPDSLGATVLGMGQTWQDYSASRSVGVTYTNSTGRTIMVSIAGNMVSANQSLQFFINGVAYCFSVAAYAANSWMSITGLIIPPGATYKVATSSGSFTINNWGELR